MTRISSTLAKGWMRLGTRFLPFADAATTELPLGRLLRLSLFQVSTGISIVLLNGTLNRVMIVELGVSTLLVSLMVSIPLVFAPFRVLIGFKSDNHRSVLGWRRVPYIWMGTLIQFGGFAILPFALLVLSGTGEYPAVYGQFGAALAFLLVGAGMHTAQTAGLALATDLAPADARPRVVAFLYVMLLFGMAGSALIFSELLRNFNEIRLIQVIQGVAVTQLLLNIAALWKQEARNPALTSAARERPEFQHSWARFRNAGGSVRVLVAVALGTSARHSARALWRRDPPADRGPDHGSHGALRARHAGRIWPCRKDARTQRRSLSHRRLRRGSGRIRVRCGDLRGAPGLGAAVSDRNCVDRLRRRSVCGGNADRRDGAGAGR
jgi:BCD family chlorophyll transporter-like MFS transporter